MQPFSEPIAITSPTTKFDMQVKFNRKSKHKLIVDNWIAILKIYFSFALLQISRKNIIKLINR